MNCTRENDALLSKQQQMVLLKMEFKHLGEIEKYEDRIRKLQGRNGELKNKLRCVNREWKEKMNEKEKSMTLMKEQLEFKNEEVNILKSLVKSLQDRIALREDLFLENEDHCLEKAVISSECDAVIPIDFSSLKNEVDFSSGHYEKELLAFAEDIVSDAESDDSGVEADLVESQSPCGSYVDVVPLKDFEMTDIKTSSEGVENVCLSPSKIVNIAAIDLPPPIATRSILKKRPSRVVKHQQQQRHIRFNKTTYFQVIDNQSTRSSGNFVDLLKPGGKFFCSAFLNDDLMEKVRSGRRSSSSNTTLPSISNRCSSNVVHQSNNNLQQLNCDLDRLLVM